MSNRSNRDEVGPKVLALVAAHAPKPKRTRQDVPELPAEAVLQEPPANAFPWLRDYLNFSRKWSPRSPKAMHEAVALWTLSTAAAGRVVYHDGKKRRAALYQLVVAPSTLYAKTSCAEIGADLLAAADLEFLLLPRATPQAQFELMRLRVPSDYQRLTADQKEDVRRQLAFVAQRGWFADEFGASLAAMQHSRSHMAELSTILLDLYNSPEKYSRGTIAHGYDAAIKRPTLSLLAISTPAQLGEAMRRNDKLWNDGTLARCAFVSVAPDETPTTASWPQGERKFPPDLIEALRKMDRLLGTSTVEVTSHDEPASTKNGQPTIAYSAAVTRWSEYHVTLSEELQTCVTNYDNALHSLMTNGEGGVPTNLHASYGRFADRGKRIACLLAASEGKSSATKEHWAKAQAIVERGRKCLHWVYNGLADEYGEGLPADKVCDLLERKGALSVREIQKHLQRQPWAAKTDSLQRELSGLVDSGTIYAGKIGRKTVYAMNPIESTTGTR
jgi:hypothetical protein